ncbi:MAG: hypothetical protein SVY15_07085 [Halobacteriota archaeon]|nr:hypothetical protein [Halobacteriota archaeon]
MMSILKRTDAQISMDFLAGITIFLVTFIAIALFIPGMFTPFQSETIDLNSVAYRTSVILVEDPGRWNNTTVGGSDWEKNTTTRTNLKRLGLAIDKDNPNVLNLSKIKYFNNETYLNNSEIIFNLSLYRRIGTTNVTYGYNISIIKLGDGTLLAERGDNISSTSGDVVTMKRTVLAQTGYIALFNGSNLTQDNPINNTKALINITGPIDEDVIFEITNFNISGIDPKFQTMKINGTLINAGMDFDLYKKTNVTEFILTNPPPPVGLNSTDTLKYVINSALFGTGNNTIELNFENVSFPGGGPTEYPSNLQPIYELARLTVRVWS